MEELQWLILQFEIKNKQKKESGSGVNRIYSLKKGLAHYVEQYVLAQYLWKTYNSKNR